MAMTVSVTLSEVSDTNFWEEFCDKYEWNVYCLREGADEEWETAISMEDAIAWGLVKD